jgi:hypothetical protein
MPHAARLWRAGSRRRDLRDGTRPRTRDHYSEFLPSWKFLYLKAPISTPCPSAFKSVLAEREDCGGSPTIVKMSVSTRVLNALIRTSGRRQRLKARAQNVTFRGNPADSGTLSSARCNGSSYFYELLFRDTGWSQDSSSGAILRASTVPFPLEPCTYVPFYDHVAVSPDIRPAARCPRRAVEILGCACATVARTSNAQNSVVIVAKNTSKLPHTCP